MLMRQVTSSDWRIRIANRRQCGFLANRPGMLRKLYLTISWTARHAYPSHLVLTRMMYCSRVVRRVLHDSLSDLLRVLSRICFHFPFWVVRVESHNQTSADRAVPIVERNLDLSPSRTQPFWIVKNALARWSASRAWTSSCLILFLWDLRPFICLIVRGTSAGALSVLFRINSSRMRAITRSGLPLIDLGSLRGQPNAVAVSMFPPLIGLLSNRSWTPTGTGARVPVSQVRQHRKRF